MTPYANILLKKTSKRPYSYLYAHRDSFQGTSWSTRGWQVWCLQARPWGWIPKEELMLQFKYKTTRCLSLCKASVFLFFFFFLLYLNLPERSLPHYRTYICFTHSLLDWLLSLSETIFIVTSRLGSSSSHVDRCNELWCRKNGAKRLRRLICTVKSVWP